MAESDKILKKYRNRIMVTIKGEVYKGKPEQTIEEDMTKFQAKFDISTQRIMPKLEYYFGPYQEKLKVKEKCIHGKEEKKAKTITSSVDKKRRNTGGKILKQKNVKIHEEPPE